METDDAPRAPSPTDAPDPRGDEQRALLREEPWGRTLRQLTAIAFKRIRGRSMSDADDLAQAAIENAHKRIEAGGWDPQKAPLMSFLVAQVIGLSANQRRRKRNSCEIALDEEVEDEDHGTVSPHERHLAKDDPAPDETLHRLRFASTVHERLVQALAGDELALQLVTLMAEGIATPRDLAAAAGRSLDEEGREEVRQARRRVRYHAEEITRELSATTEAQE